MVTSIEPLELFVATFFFGLFTELLGADRVNRNIAIMMMGQWFFIAGIVWWGLLSLPDVMAVLLALAAPQLTRIIRRVAAWVLDKRDDGRKKARARQAAAPYLERHCRNR